MKHTLKLLTATLFTAVEPSTTLMQRIMKAADKNNDGKLTLEEFRPLDVQARHHGDEHFKAGDKNSDGFIDATELVGALNKQTWFAILSESVEASFTRIDANKDRKLDAPEYRRISKMGGHSEQHFKSADANKDGFLDFSEFTAHAEHRLAALESARQEKMRSIK